MSTLKIRLTLLAFVCGLFVADYAAAQGPFLWSAKYRRIPWSDSTTLTPPGPGQIPFGFSAADLDIIQLVEFPNFGTNNAQELMAGGIGGANTYAAVSDGTLGPPQWEDEDPQSPDWDDTLAATVSFSQVHTGDKVVTCRTDASVSMGTAIGQTAAIPLQDIGMFGLISSFGFDGVDPPGPFGVPLGFFWDAELSNGCVGVTSWTFNNIDNSAPSTPGGPPAVPPATNPATFSTTLFLSILHSGGIQPDADGFFLTGFTPDPAVPVVRIAVEGNFIQASWDSVADAWVVQESVDRGANTTVAIESLNFGRFLTPSVATTVGAISGLTFDVETFINTPSSALTLDAGGMCDHDYTLQYEGYGSFYVYGYN